jgi:small conductance mechanosensitive channel
VLADPKVDVEILELIWSGRCCGAVYCHNDHYWVYFDTNRVIKEALGAAGFPTPMPAQNVIVTQAA